MIVSRRSFPAPLLILDDFMSESGADECLQECIDLRPVYMPASVGQGQQNRRDPKIRRNDVVMMDSVFSADRNRSRILSLLDSRVKSEECNRLWHKGYSLFDVINYADWRETVLSRYGMCDFYGKHQDVMVNKDDPNAIKHRLVTIVLYLNTNPEKFRGGELTLYEDGVSHVVVPRHNRAVVFPSYVWHSVENVTLPDSEPFSSGRFSVNHWMGFK